MGNKACTIAVQTEESTHSSGTDVNGKIYISVNDPNGVEANSLNLCFCGEEKVVVHYTEDGFSSSESDSDRGRHRDTIQYDRYERKTSPIFHLDEPIHSTMNGRLAKGQYEFPFRVIVPQFAPSSMRFHYGESKCQIRYYIQAYLNVGGERSSHGMFFNPFQQNTFTSPKTFLEIIGAQQLERCVNGPIDIPPETQRVRKCCCINKGTMTLKSDVENDVFIPNGTYYLNYALNNNSTVSIQGVEVKLEENIEFQAYGRNAKSKTNLVRLYEDGDFTGNCDEQMHDRLISNAMSSRQVQLRIPRGARSSYSGKLIEIYHTLHIIVKTECCISNPESCIDVSIIERPIGEAAYCTTQPEPSAPFMEKPSAPFVSQPEPSAPFFDEEEDVVVDATVLPDDWYPVRADVAHLPIATRIS